MRSRSSQGYNPSVIGKQGSEQDINACLGQTRRRMPKLESSMSSKSSMFQVVAVNSFCL